MNTEEKMLWYVCFSPILVLSFGRHEIGKKTSWPLWFPVLGIVGVYYSIDTSALMFWLCVVATLVTGWGALTPFRDYISMLRFLRERDIYDEAVYDFYSSLPFMNDHIRLGNEFVFGRNYCVILRYSDIRRVYQYTFKLNFVETNRELHAVDLHGKVWRLCELEVHRMFSARKNELLDEQAAKVLSLMLRKNPRIAIGYRS